MVGDDDGAGVGPRTGPGPLVPIVGGKQMTDQPDFAYVRPIDRTALGAAAPEERFTQHLLGHGNGARNCTIDFIRTPPGGGSPDGLHTHEVEQVFYILEGTMSIEVDGTTYEAPPGNLVIFPAGVPHRNWNGTDAATLHLAFNTPAPDPARPFATKAAPTSG
jgi:quercetin dioxygenase-like cupin family protein